MQITKIKQIKNIIIYIISYANNVIYLIKRTPIKINNKNFIFCKVNISKNNTAKFIGPRNKLLTININGRNNNITSFASLSKTEIRISGHNNFLLLEKGVTTLSGTIIIIGNNCSIKIRKNTTLGFDMYIVCMGENNYIDIGQECMIADNVDIWSSDSHPIYDANNNIINPSKPIIIKNHVWLGKNVKVMKGVTIGENAIIGLNSIITHDIEPSTLNAGSPTKKIKGNVRWERKHIKI